MRTLKTIATICIFLFVVSLNRTGKAQTRSPLTEAQQQHLLSTRLRGGAIIGPFSSYGSFLYAAMDVAIHTEDKQIGESDLHSPFPEFYRQTWKELFDTIALQTGSSWKYDPQRDYWVFAKPSAPKPFVIAVAEKWVGFDRGVYVSYKPPTYPVGMDIYCYGDYSSDNPQKVTELWKAIRDSWAIGFASHFKSQVTVEEMQTVKVDGVEALYFQIPTPRPGVIWRQWAFVSRGKAFVIVSTLPADDKQLISEVESMVKSFHVP